MLKRGFMAVLLAVMLTTLAWADEPPQAVTITADPTILDVPGPVLFSGTSIYSDIYQVELLINGTAVQTADLVDSQWDVQLDITEPTTVTAQILGPAPERKPLDGVTASVDITVAGTPPSAPDPGGDASPNLGSSPPPSPAVDETPAGASSPSVEQTPNAGESPSGTSSPNATSQPEEESTLSKVLGYALKGALGLVVSLIGIALLIWGGIKVVKAWKESRSKPAKSTKTPVGEPDPAVVYSKDRVVWKVSEATELVPDVIQGAPLSIKVEGDKISGVRVHDQTGRIWKDAGRGTAGTYHIRIIPTSRMTGVQGTAVPLEIVIEP